MITGIQRSEYQRSHSPGSASLLIEMETKVVSDPWSVLPIKNAKCARGTSEVHLSDRNIEVLGNFESFPNLEVLWLNNNKVTFTQLRRIDNLDANFRIKHLFCENNRVHTLEGSLSHFTFLTTLLLGDNHLRNLDRLIEKLAKFTCLEALNLYGNPCAEEPYYRLKVIHAIPSLRVFDRHDVTVIERIKAESVVTKLQEGPSAPKREQKQHNSRKQLLSVGEKILSSQVREIRLKREIEAETEEKRLEESKVRLEAVVGVPPCPGRDRPATFEAPDFQVSETEKDCLKPLYAAYDKGEIHADKTGMETADFERFVGDVMVDRGDMGKVPTTDAAEIVSVMAALDKNPAGKLLWRTFKKAANAWTWRKLSPSELQPRIDDYYAKARKAEMSGKPTEAKEYAIKALRVEGLRSQKEVKIQHVEERHIEPKRVDTYTQFRLVADEHSKRPLVTTIYNSTQPMKIVPNTLTL